MAQAGCLSRGHSAVCRCGAGKSEEARKQGPPQVGYVVVQPGPVPMSISLGGRTVAFETSEVRPQVNGIIRQRNFAEGSYVARRTAAVPDRPQPVPRRAQPGPGQCRGGASERTGGIGTRRAVSAAGRNGGDLAPGIHRCARAGPPGTRRGRAERGCARHRPDQPATTPPCRRRSAAASAARCSPSARWSTPTRPSRSR